VEDFIYQFIWSSISRCFGEKNYYNQPTLTNVVMKNNSSIFGMHYSQQLSTYYACVTETTAIWVIDRSVVEFRRLTASK